MKRNRKKVKVEKRFRNRSPKKGINNEEGD